MATKASTGYLATLSIGDDSSPINYQHMMEVKSIKPNMFTVPVLSATHLGSPRAMEEKRPGLMMPGSVDVFGNFLSDASQMRILELAEARTVFNFKITTRVNSGTQLYILTGTGFISEYDLGPFESSVDAEFAMAFEIASFDEHVDNLSDWINATGFVAFYQSRALGGFNQATALWEDFELISPMPTDAVIQGIYPVLICSANHDQALGDYYSYGTDVTLTSSQLARFLNPFEPDANFGSPLTFPETEFWSDSVGSSLSDLDNMKIAVSLASTFPIDVMTDTITVTAVGFAIYYITAKPPSDPPPMPAPFGAPSGQAVAWALPMSSQQTGIVIGSPLIFGPSTSTGLASPAVQR